MNTEPHEVHQAPYIPETQEVALTQVQESPQVALSPFDMAPVQFQEALDRRSVNMNALLKWLASALKDGTHFGRIHVVGKDKCALGARCTNDFHFSKPVLFKAGAEKVNQFLGLTARYPNAWEYEQKALRNEGFEWIALRCELVSASGNVVAQGMGCRKFTGDLNKDIKMAEKSGRIDATIQLGLSDCYTQDLDDMVKDGAGEDLTSTLEASIEAVKAKKAAEAPPLSDATKEMLEIARKNREREQAKLDERGPVDRAKLRAAGFDIAEPEDKPQTCSRCGGDLKRYEKNGVAYMQCVGGRQEWLDLIRSGKTAQEASALTKGHTYKKLRD